MKTKTELPPELAPRDVITTAEELIELPPEPPPPIDPPPEAAPVKAPEPFLRRS